MIDDLQVRRWFRPGFRKQPDPSPQSTPEQEPTHTAYALQQYAYGSSWCAHSAAMCGRHKLWRHPETTRGYAPVKGIFDSGPVCQHPQCCYRQYQPVPRDPCGVSPSSLLPLPPDALERSEAQLYPEPKSIPTHSRFIRREVGHHHPRLVLVVVPDHDHCSTTPFARGPESCPRPSICVPWSRYKIPRWQASSSVRAEDCVDRLSRVGMPSRRAYLLPQSRAPQTPVTHDQHRHVLRDRFRQQRQQTHCRGYPLAGSVGRQDVPGNGNSAAAIDGTYDDGVYLVALHCRVYSQHQLVRLPPCKQPSKQRNKAQSHIQLHMAGAGTVAPIVQPLPEVLAQAVPVTHDQKSRHDGVLATTPGQYGAVDPQDQSFYLGPLKVRHVMFNGLLHLVAFSWKAHGESLASFLCGTKKTARKPCAFQVLILFQYLYLPLSAREGRREWLPASHRRPPPLWVPAFAGTTVVQGLVRNSPVVLVNRQRPPHPRIKSGAGSSFHPRGEKGVVAGLTPETPAPLGSRLRGNDGCAEVSWRDPCITCRAGRCRGVANDIAQPKPPPLWIPAFAGMTVPPGREETGQPTCRTRRRRLWRRLRGRGLWPWCR